MGLFILLILVFLAMYLSVLINTDRVLAKFGNKHWQSVWRWVEIGLVLMAVLAIAFDFETELACVLCALVILCGGIAVYFRFSSVPWKIALIIAVIMLIVGAFYSVWSLLAGSFVILVRSITFFDD